ncbi:uncharacterized protein [Amphiura filiformis]|uniref:uncharacterized protein n=1 Tax=Amphiura filiformis TaxID=82378 RepID=UPI003B2266E2
MAHNLEQILVLITADKKLDRDRGLGELNRKINNAEPHEMQAVETALTRFLQDSTASWETHQGALLAAKLVLGSNLSSDHFAAELRLHALHQLNNNEARVRLAAGELLGALCKRCGPEVYESSKDIILEGVRCNLERAPLNEASLEEQNQVHALTEKLARSQKDEGGASAEQIFHDTAGWKNLETWMRCLQSVIEGCGQYFLPHVTQDLLDLVFQALTHTNRFVRETGYYVCGTLVSCSTMEGAEDHMESDDGIMTDDNEILQHGEQFARHLAEGLADNWSQVRLAASVATRKFLLALPDGEARERFNAILLPRMCLNRYYVAEGVRIYSQETWRAVTGTQGKRMVEEYICDVVQYYVAQTEADNHAVREAACACIAELGSKIDSDVVRPYVNVLLKALLVCFKDDSWPVRDAACIACGNFVLCFPDEARPSMEALYPLFFANLADFIPSVRQGSAVALANVAKAYGDEAIANLFSKIQEGIAGLENQPNTTEKYSEFDSVPAQFGVVKRLRDNDMELHSDKQMYSCGSLAPKMGRGSKGGCMDHQFKKPSEPWEFCDGCVQLLAELSSQQDLAAQVATILPAVANATRKQHYAQYVVLLETVCKSLPVIAKNIGKRHFKPNLENFFDAIFHALSCDNALCSSAASLCLLELGQFLGPNILKGRVENYNPSYVDKLLANQCAAPY